MTIDEAIEKYNKLANNDRTCYPEEAQQLVEWLEELKVYQQHEIICNKAYNAGYNKAIDDFVKGANEMAIEVDTGTYTMKAIGIGLLEHIAEQLKAGANNGTDNQ